MHIVQELLIFGWYDFDVKRNIWSEGRRRKLEISLILTTTSLNFKITLPKIIPNNIQTVSTKIWFKDPFALSRQSTKTWKFQIFMNRVYSTFDSDNHTNSHSSKSHSNAPHANRFSHSLVPKQKATFLWIDNCNPLTKFVHF